MTVVRELAQIHVEFYQPGEYIRGLKNIRRYLDWNKKGSRMFLIPGDDPASMMEEHGDHLLVTKPFAAIQTQAIGETFTGITSGIIDDICLRYGQRFAFASALEDILEYAVLNTRRQLYKSYTWVGIFDVDEETEEIMYMGSINLENIMMKIGV